MTYDFNLMN